MKQITLPASHYASGWKTEGVIKPIHELTDLGRRYAELPAGMPDKEALLLELCQCFHPYLMKYLVKHFHLAFKGMDTSEIYDVLMAQLVMTIKGYDPNYTEKLRLAVEVINRELLQKDQFSFADINRHLDFDCHRCVRLLGRLGFLKAIQEGKDKRITGYVRSETWPPPAKFFQSGAIGVAHYIQKWFRFKLQEWIVSRMREVESKEGVYSLEGWLEYRTVRLSQDECFSDHHYVREQVPSLMGEYQDASGNYLTADVSMIEKPLRLLCRWDYLKALQKRRAGSLNAVHRPSAAPRNASKSLAAALDSSNSLANKSSALQKSTRRLPGCR